MNASTKLASRLLAAACLAVAGATPVHAAYVYILDTKPSFAGGTGLGDFQLTVDDLITTNTVFALGAFDMIAPLPGTTSITFGFASSANEAAISFDTTGLGIFWSAVGTFSGPGTYCSGFGDCSVAVATMTIREVGQVSEPGALPLSAAALAAAAFAGLRRRRPHHS